MSAAAGCDFIAPAPRASTAPRRHEFSMEVRSLLVNAAVVVAATAAVGCATTAKPSSSTANLAKLTLLANLPGKPACFWKSNFQGDWTVLNDSTLIVRAPLAQDAYVVKLFEPVFDLSLQTAPRLRGPRAHGPDLRQWRRLSGSARLAAAAGADHGGSSADEGRAKRITAGCWYAGTALAHGC